MATLERQPVRSEIKLGDHTVDTWDVVSFNVSKTRGQASATFTASVKVPYTMVDTGRFVARDIVIRAGLKGSLKTIFTGQIYKCVVNPIRTDASKVMLNLSGKDDLGKLEGQKVNRRLTTYRDGDTPIQRWGVVNSVTKQNTPNRERFKSKLFSPNPQGIVGIDPRKALTIDDIYKMVSEKLGKDTKFSPVGGMSAEKVVR